MSDSTANDTLKDTNVVSGELTNGRRTKLPRASRSVALLLLLVSSFLLTSLLLSSDSFGAQKRKSGKRKPASKASAETSTGASAAASASAGQSVVVKTENAFVFETADVDASAISYLSAGDAIRVSRKVYGQGEQKFYKVKLPNGRFGYVLTIDVTRSGKGDKSRAAKDRALKDTKAMDPRELERRENARIKRELAKPMVFNRWFGVLLGNLAYKEKVKGVKAQDNLLIYGLKITGPDVLLEGPIMDINVFLHFGAPSYYQQLSKVRPSGFILMSDALLLFPFGMGQNSSLFLAGGPLLKFTNFKILPASGGVKNPQEFSVGGSFALGGAYRMGAVSLRLEGKYLIERTSYTIVQVGIQTLY